LRSSILSLLSCVSLKAIGACHRLKRGQWKGGES